MPPSALTVAAWLAKWLPRHHAAGHIGDSSRERYAGIIHVHIDLHIGAMALQDLRPDHVADLRTRWLIEDGLSPATVTKQLNVLRRALSDAVEDGLLAQNPADRVKAPRQHRKQEQRALTGDEMPIRFNLATGVRRGELLALRWGDVDLDGRSVRIRGTKTRHSNRTIRISAPTAAQLRAMRPRRRSNGSGWAQSGRTMIASSRRTTASPKSDVF